MQFKFPIPGILFLSFATGFAQVASHAPTGVAHPPAQTPASLASATGKAVARVNGAVLTENDLLREEYAIFPYARQHGGGIPKDMAPQIRDGAMKMLIFEELVYQEAQRRKMTIAPARMQRAEAEFRKQFSTPAEFNAFVQSDFHGSQDLLREKIRRSLLIETLLKAEVDSKSVVTPAEIRAYYDKNPARFQHPETFTFQTISILPPAKATADQLKEGRKRAEDALRKAKATKNGDDFGLLAEKISDDDYRVMMGQHKPVPVNELPPQIVKAMTGMKPGAVSDLIQVDQAYTIVRFEQHTPAGKTPYLDVKASLAKELQQTKTNQLRAALGAKLRQNATIEQP